VTIGMTSRLRMVDGKPGHLLHFCPACLTGHVIDVHAVSRDGHVTGWDGTWENPTIAQPVRHEKDGAVCEYILRAGVLHFLNSSSHGLSGKTVPLPHFPLP
jgi:hypothetical protein